MQNAPVDFHQVMRNKVIEKYSSMWSILDPAHQLDHFDNVYEDAITLFHKNPTLNVNSNEIFLVAYFHDLFTWSRENHHQLIETFIYTTKCPLVNVLFSGDDDSKNRVARACAEHRASYKGDYYSQLSLLMASADRGIPKDINTLIERSYKYQLANVTKDKDEAILLAKRHIVKKFSKEGYARIPKLLYNSYRLEFEKIWTEVDKLKEA